MQVTFDAHTLSGTRRQRWNTPGALLSSLPPLSAPTTAMPLTYALVARDTTVLCDHSAFAGNVPYVAKECLQQLQPGQDKLTMAVDRHTLNFLRRDGFTFMVAADEAIGREVPFAFLERCSDDFVRGGFASRATAYAAPSSLSRTFGPRLKQHMEYISQHPDEVSRVIACQRKCDDVRAVMLTNVDKVLLRGEKLEVLTDKAEALNAQAQAFQRQGRTLQRSMWWQNARMKVVVVLAVLLLVVVIFVLACFAGGKNCTKRG